LPAILSFDLAGIVVKTGPGVDFPLGVHVFAQSWFKHFSTCGGLQEYAIVDPLYSSIVPSNITDLDAVVFPMNATTVAYALFSSKGHGIPFPGTPESKSFDYKSQKLVIIGGGTNTGKLAIQLARIAGIGTIVAVASLSSEAELKSLGATHVVARQASDIKSQVRAIVSDDLVYTLDTFNKNDDLALAVSLLSDSKKGTLIHLVPGKPLDVEAQGKPAGYEQKWIGGYSNLIPEFGQLWWKQLRAWLESGELKILKYNVIKGLDAEKINKAIDQIGTWSNQRFHISL
jgi:NADPH2:quinone reductase